ncbi:MAG TPA: thiamine phosphate synthase [Bryobacteraceae bacterium]|nr:thiamine phosphate synthase [Bryobacteraceae bacterium]
MTLPPFYPIVSSLATAEILLEAGARIIQYRNKEFFSRAAFEEAARIAELCRSAGALFVINDRADIAKLLDAALHLGQDDLAPSDARKILPAPAVIGFSTHNEQQLRAADSEPVDYLAIGPIFATGSKQNPDPVVGLDRLRTLRSLTQKPLVAIGGITRALAPQVFEAGADSVAIIGDLYPETRARAAEWVALSADARDVRARRVRG